MMPREKKKLTIPQFNMIALYVLTALSVISIVLTIFAMIMGFI